MLPLSIFPQDLTSPTPTGLVRRGYLLWLDITDDATKNNDNTDKNMSALVDNSNVTDNYDPINNSIKCKCITH